MEVSVFEVASARRAMPECLWAHLVHLAGRVCDECLGGQGHAMVGKIRSMIY